MTTSSINKIALINFGGLGDAVLFLPVIQALIQHYPNSKITLITEDRAKGIIDLLPSSQVSVVAIKVQGRKRHQLFLDLLSQLFKGRFDAVISSGSNPLISILLAVSGIPLRVGYDTGRLSRRLLTGTAILNQNQYAAKMHLELAKSFLMLTHNSADALNNEALPQDLSLEQLSENLPELLVRSTDKKRIAIHPGVSLASIEKRILKGWSVEAWVELAKKIVASHSDVEIILLGGPDDTQIIEALTTQLPQESYINLAYQTKTIKSLMATLSAIDLLICVDSAPMHLAVALNRPVVPLFSGTNEVKLLPECYLPYVACRPTEEVACRPCMFDNRLNSCDTPICLDITVDTVYQKVEKALMMLCSVVSQI